jgi:hypothetical protein
MSKFNDYREALKRVNNLVDESTWTNEVDSIDIRLTDVGVRIQIGKNANAALYLTEHQLDYLIKFHEHFFK